jgi:hypothetical protein
VVRRPWCPSLRPRASSIRRHHALPTRAALSRLTPPRRTPPSRYTPRRRTGPQRRNQSCSSPARREGRSCDERHRILEGRSREERRAAGTQRALRPSKPVQPAGTTGELDRTRRDCRDRPPPKTKRRSSAFDVGPSSPPTAPRAGSAFAANSERAASRGEPGRPRAGGRLGRARPRTRTQWVRAVTSPVFPLPVMPTTTACVTRWCAGIVSGTSPAHPPDHGRRRRLGRLGAISRRKDMTSSRPH